MVAGTNGSGQCGSHSQAGGGGEADEGTAVPAIERVEHTMMCNLVCQNSAVSAITSN